ncbi:MAG: hypothetical protein M3346_10930, partial [Actinomycetota bacterium]|nr:hypothetical protein [Actinomycetota bacterium]
SLAFLGALRIFSRVEGVFIFQQRTLQLFEGLAVGIQGLFKALMGGTHKCRIYITLGSDKRLISRVQFVAIHRTA